jgi:PHD/YefM family antitoxin component YafN of YafNO toxin-antitoxin module
MTGSAAPIPITRPISDLRTRLPEIEQAARESGEPIVLTRNGLPSLVVFDSDAYNERIQAERHVRKLREAEIEAKYRTDSHSLSSSKARIQEIRSMLGTAHA